MHTLIRSMLTGAIGFSIVSLIVFSTVAFGERWMYQTLGLYGSYLAWTAMFILLGAVVLGALLVNQKFRQRFYLLFAAAFFAYALGWVCAYFVLRGTPGEWVGSAVGSFLMALVFGAGFAAIRSIVKSWILLFVTNSIGYFVGSAIYEAVAGRAGMMFWGAVYGFFLGSGIAAVLHLSQTHRTPANAIQG